MLRRVLLCQYMGAIQVALDIVYKGECECTTGPVH
jgi:hypothetical protein